MAALGNLGAQLDALSGERNRALDIIGGRGAVPVEVPTLLPADLLLDLYGEDIRARAYVVNDPDGDLVLRPDFTVPIAQLHIKGDTAPAQYGYSGLVWRHRAQSERDDAAYWQVGYESLGNGDVAEDINVFDIFQEITARYGLVPRFGDLGIIIAGLESLDISAPRKAALRRHIWRPARFERLINTYRRVGGAARSHMPLLEAYARGGIDAALGHFARTGLRAPADIERRLERLVVESQEKPLDQELIDSWLRPLLSFARLSADPVRDLRRFEGASAEMDAVIERYRLRMDKLAPRPSHPMPEGGVHMEYYDGFVFDFIDPKRPYGAAVAQGGRYDALTRALGGDLPAIGGVYRPELALAIGETA